MRQPVERRHGEVEVPVLDELGHLLVEKRDEERRDVGAVDIGVGHDDHALVAQVLVAVLAARAGAQGLDQIRQ